MKSCRHSQLVKIILSLKYELNSTINMEFCDFFSFLGIRVSGLFHSSPPNCLEGLSFKTNFQGVGQAQILGLGVGATSS